MATVYVLVHTVQIGEELPETKILGVYTTYEKAYDKLSRHKMNFELEIESQGENVNLYLATHYEYSERNNDGITEKIYSGDDFYYGYEFGPTLTRKTISYHNYEELIIEKKIIE